ncbi:unnamed protein product [Nippostrongylus brasiliensis]|uniref:Uncharacterized protein n=1 Tax=Nippostrongylus brasiliensis TaxID=27835 RepID=A0A3P7BPS5_NIPBR|nr:unnamed protein product [Nippostrongylus brasiliensis]
MPYFIENHVIRALSIFFRQAVLYAVYALATLFAPWVCLRIGAKWSLFSGSLLFTAYQLGFFYLNSYYFYLTQALMGIGFALYYAGQGLYMSEHSSRSTLTRNSTLVSAIGQSSMLFGGIALAIISYVRQMSTTDSEKTADLTDDGYRNFSNGEIHVIYGVLLGFTVLSNIIFALTPTKATSDAKMDAVEKTTLRTQLGHLFNAAREPRIFLLSFFFIFYGLHVSFWLGAYPTSFAFSKILSANVYLPAYYSAMTGVGNIIVGVYISFFDKRYPNFGLIPTMITQLVLGTITFGITIASTSNLSTIQTNDDRSMWIEPS